MTTTEGVEQPGQPERPVEPERQADSERQAIPSGRRGRGSHRSTTRREPPSGPSTPWIPSAPTRRR